MKLKDGYLDHLEAVLLLSHGTQPKPRLDDSTVWFYRASDISDIINEEAAPEENMSRLVVAYRQALGLLDEEIAILFDEQVTPEGQSQLSAEDGGISEEGRNG